MKFCKNLLSVVELSDPEWGPFWINYKLLKKKIKAIEQERELTNTNQPPSQSSLENNHTGNTEDIAKSPAEKEFFRFLMAEVRKVSEFFLSSEQLYRIRHSRLQDGLRLLQEKNKPHDKNTWSRLLSACVRFYKDILLLENYAIMQFCGFSKILKKHDKISGLCTREAFLRNVLKGQNFVDYPNILILLRESEKLFEDMQNMESVMPLLDEERMFIAAIRDLNFQASRLQAEEKATTIKDNDGHHNLAADLDDDNSTTYNALEEAALKVRQAQNNVSQSPRGIQLDNNLHTDSQWMQENLNKLKANLRNEEEKDQDEDDDDVGSDENRGDSTSSDDNDTRRRKVFNTKKMKLNPNSANK